MQIASYHLVWKFLKSLILYNFKDICLNVNNLCQFWHEIWDVKTEEKLIYLHISDETFWWFSNIVPPLFEQIVRRY